MKLPALCVVFALGTPVWLPAQASSVLENRNVRVEMQNADASIVALDKKSGVAWTIQPPRVVLSDQTALAVRPSGEVKSTGDTIRFSFDRARLDFQVRISEVPAALEYSYTGGSQSFNLTGMDIDEVQLLSDSLEIGPGPDNSYAIPSRLGALVTAEGDRPFRRRMNAFGHTAGYSMAMMGAVKNGSALLLTWEAPYTDLIFEYQTTPRPRLTAGLALRQTARKARLEFLGRGGYVEAAKAYRRIARERGYLKTLAEKLKENPALEKMFGAADFKPFVFRRTLSRGPQGEAAGERLQIGYTFDEAAKVAEHFKRDLGIDRAMLVLAGWIRRGYDNQHPDILPAAPELGGDQALRDCSRRVKNLGWLFGLHDNYQDIYADAPSFADDLIIKNPDGSKFSGGKWDGGQAWIICPRKALELLARPQNFPKVQELFAPDVYFVDCVFANPLRACYDPRHPVTKVDDIRLKQQLAGYIGKRSVMFGSEEGFEYGVAQSHYFEGIMSQKGRERGSSVVIPLFELVYGDAIPLLTHQGDRVRPDNPEYILSHILYAEMPVYDFGQHLYWTNPAGQFKPKEGSEPRLVFAQGNRFGMTDQFIKNTYEVLSPLNRVTALLPMTDHRFLTPNRTVESTRFGSDVEITVNYGPGDYSFGNTVLPQYGFVVESPRLVAFHARQYRGAAYREPTLCVIRSLDSRPLSTSASVRLYRAFGDRRIEFRGQPIEVETEKTIGIGTAR